MLVLEPQEDVVQGTVTMVVGREGEGGADDTARPDRGRYHENKIDRGLDRFVVCERTENAITAQTQPDWTILHCVACCQSNFLIR